MPSCSIDVPTKLARIFPSAMYIVPERFTEALGLMVQIKGSLKLNKYERVPTPTIFADVGVGFGVAPVFTVPEVVVGGLVVVPFGNVGVVVAYDAPRSLSPE
jgi:hypothetical protein